MSKIKLRSRTSGALPPEPIMITFIIIYILIGLLYLCWAVYKDYSNGIDTTVKEILLFLVTSILVGPVLALWEIIEFVLTEIPDKVIIKGKKNVDNFEE